MKPKRHKTISVKVTEDEYALIQKIAESKKINQSDVLRLPITDASFGYAQ